MVRLVGGATAPKRWAKLDFLGRGAHGGVFSAVNRDTGDVFAVKQQALVRGGAARVGALLEQFSHEIALMRSLHNEHVVRYLGASIEGGTLNLFMEHIGGGSLSEHLASVGAFSETVIRVYARQILEGLAYLHTNGILHCDIKGANILVDKAKDGKAVLKLTDFGCSRKLQTSLLDGTTSSSSSSTSNSATTTNSTKNGSPTRRPRSLSGTPYFVAPEVILGREYSRASDIYSFGCTLVEMATGHAPLSQQYPDPSQALYHIHQGGAVAVPASLSPALRDLIAICLQRDPRRRQSALQLLQHPFFASSAPPSPTSSPPPPEPPAPSSRPDSGGGSSSSSSGGGPGHRSFLSWLSQPFKNRMV